MLGWDSYYDYIHVVINNQAKFRSFAYNLSIAGFWHKLFDPVGETGPVEPLWRSPALAHWGTLLSDLAITMIVVMVTHRAQTPVQRDLAFALTVTAMLLVSPVTWDFSLPLLLVSIAVVAARVRRSHARGIVVALILILTIDWIPQNILTELMQAGSSSQRISLDLHARCPFTEVLRALGYICGRPGLLPHREARELAERPLGRSDHRFCDLLDHICPRKSQVKHLVWA